MVAAYALFVRELRLASRDRAGLCLLLLVPVLAISISGFALRALFEGGPARIHLTILDRDQGEVSKVIRRRLMDIPSLELTDAVRASRGFRLVIPEHFSERYGRGERARLLLETDPGRQGEGHVVRAIVREMQVRLAAGQTAARIAAGQILAHTGDLDVAALREESGRGAVLADADTVAIDERARTDSEAALRSFDLQVPGLAIMFLLFGALNGVGRRVLEDERQGWLQRVLLAPNGMGGLLAGLLGARLLIGIAQMTALLFFGHVAFGLPLGASPAAVALVVVVAVLAAVSFGLMLGSLAGSEEQLNALGVGGILSMAALGGCWWPLYLEPEWMQRIATLTMTKWAMDALTDVLLRGESLRGVAPALGLLCAFASVCLSVGLVRYQRRFYGA